MFEAVIDILLKFIEDVVFVPVCMLMDAFKPK